MDQRGTSVPPNFVEGAVELVGQQLEMQIKNESESAPFADWNTYTPWERFGCGPAHALICQ
jgi:hypothetical protein